MVTTMAWPKVIYAVYNVFFFQRKMYQYTYIFEIAPIVKYPREFSKRLITVDDSTALWARV